LPNIQSSFVGERLLDEGIRPPVRN